MQESVNLFAAESGFGCDARQHLPVAEVSARHEVAAKQPLDHRVLDAPLAGKPDEPVGVEGVRRPFNTREIERHAFHRAGGCDLVIEGKRPLPTPQFGRAIRANPFLPTAWSDLVATGASEY